MPSPILSPESMLLLDGNHSIKRLAFGDMCLRRVSIPRRLCALIYRSLFLSLSFRVIAHLFHTALSRVGYLLSRRNLPYCPHSKQLRCQRWSEWYRLRLPLFRLSAGQPLLFRVFTSNLDLLLAFRLAECHSLQS